MRLPYCFSFLLLTKGQIALIDDADLAELTRHKWHSGKGNYVMRAVKANGKERKIRLHNQLMNPPEGMEADHVNRNPLDNRRKNLRLGTHQQNCLNRRGLGVYYDEKRGMYRYRVTVNGKRIGGRCKTKRTAIRRVNKLRSYYYGEFCPN